MKKKLTKKQLNMIKIGLPIFVILIVVMLVSSKGLNGLMGNTTFDKEKCKCEEGWSEGNNNTCYQENTSETLEDAKLLGDVNGDNQVNSEDYDQMEARIPKEQAQNSISSNNSLELNNIEQAVYDIDDNHIINYNDVLAFNEKFESSTDGKILKEDYQATYVCPRELTEEREENNQTIITTKTYKQDEENEKICYVTTTVRVVQAAVCESNEMSNTSSSSTKMDIEEPEESIEEPEYDISIETSVCTKEECNNDTEIKTRSNDSNMPNESVQSTDIIVEDNGEEYDEE